MEILELLAENEEHISRLYQLYAEKLPKFRDFWMKLADEEIMHATWIREFAEGVKDKTLYINEERFPREDLQIYGNYLDGSMRKALKKGIDIMGAFTTALYIEESLIELKFLKVIDSGSEDFDKVLLRLKTATIEHNERIKEYWTKVKDSDRNDIFNR